MHELALATNLMEQLERIATEQRAQRIVEVEVTCGVMQQVVPEALELAFAAVSAGTLAEGAVLRIAEEPLAGVCRECRHAFKPEIDDYLCPQCGQADVELTAGRDVLLTGLVFETEGNGPG